MADSDEESAPGTRAVSPVTQPPSPAAVKFEDEQVAAKRSLPASFDRADEASSAALYVARARARTTPVPSPTGDTSGDTSDDIDAPGDIDTTEYIDNTGDIDTTGIVDTTGEIDTTGDISTNAVQTRCVVNFLDPQPGKCDSRITNDDRHYVSNFFGRNKSCSTSIPDEFYQVLCRKCMQGMKYRLKSGQGASEIEVQVAAIKHVLRNMAASGRWVLVEVQLTKAEYDRRQNPAKYEADIKKFNDEVTKSREEAKQKGEKAKRRNTKKPQPPVPDWLAKLVVRDDEDPTHDYQPIHEREPVRYTFEELIELVDMIGANCKVLPSIECLPVTQGELDEANFKITKLTRKIAKDELGKLAEDKVKIDQLLRLRPKDETLLADLEDVRKATDDMQHRLAVAEEDFKKYKALAAESAHTLPAKREQVKKPTTSKRKAESSKTAASKKGKKTKKGALQEDDINDSQVALTDPDVKYDDDNDDNDNDMRNDSPPAEEDSRMIDPDPADVYYADSSSASPPPHWKGKGKAAPTAPPPPKATTPSSNKSNRNPSPSSTTATSVPQKRPRQPITPPPAQTQPDIDVPTTPKQKSVSSGPMTTPGSGTSTTRSTGKRLQREAERLQKLQEGEAEVEGEGEGGVTVTDMGSPVKQRVKRHTE